MKKYTFEQEEEIKARYILNPTAATVSALAAEFNVPVRSIIAKLSHFNIYKAKRYVSKSGMPPIKKAELVQKLAPIFKDFELEQLEKLSKPLIIKLISHLNYMLIDNTNNKGLCNEVILGEPKSYELR
jgi:hypothetical protein